LVSLLPASACCACSPCTCLHFSQCAPDATSGKLLLKRGFRPGGPPGAPEGRRRRLWPAVEQRKHSQVRIPHPWLRQYDPTGGHNGSHAKCDMQAGENKTVVGGFYSEVVLQKREAEGTVRDS